VTTRVAVPLAIAPGPAPRGELQRVAGETMGTTWSARFVGTPAAAVALRPALQAALDRVVAQMSLWLPNSAISNFNGGEIGQWIELPSEFWSVLETALRIAEETAGAYDPSVGALVDAWGFGPGARSAHRPPPTDIAELQRNAGWRQLQCDPVRRRVQRLAPCRLDLNGIAKGFAVDHLMQALHTHGITHAVVEIGGELSGAGIKPDGTPWWVDVDLARAGATIAPLRVALHGLSIATSGCERHFTEDGRTFSHTIDSRTGMPIDNGMVAVTVLHRSCMEADAYATAFMVMGAEAALALAERREIAAILLVADPGPGHGMSEILTPAMQAMLA
jgi:thiamine biosynthesis lipoprotein